MTTTAKCFLFDGPYDGELLEGVVEEPEFLPGVFTLESPVFKYRLVYLYRQGGWKFVQEGKSVFLKACYHYVGYQKNSNGRLTYNGEA